MPIEHVTSVYVPELRDMPADAVTQHGGQNIQGPIPVWYNVLTQITRFTSFTIAEKYKPNSASFEIIGLANGVLEYKACTTVYAPQTDITKTTFDVVTKADAALILLTNASGSTRYLLACWITGNLVKRFSGREGFLHDSFINFDDIDRNGERVFELANNFIVTKSQVEQLADYLWKKNTEKKHVYGLSLPGTRHYFEPGEWYALTASSDGESISTTVRLLSVDVDRQAGRLGNTMLIVEEDLANWTPDGNSPAHFIVVGEESRKSYDQKVTVAASGYMGPANWYCDETNDEAQLLAALNWLSGSYGGGTIQLTEGTYAIDAELVMKSNISIVGMGVKTIIDATGDFHTFNCTGLSNIVFRDFQCTLSGTPTNKAWMFVKTTSNIDIIRITFDDVYYAIFVTTTRGAASDNI